ncbi:MFS transporter, partial [Nostoc sp. NIES-2111]
MVVGFGALYGLTNGVAYSLSLILAARSMPGREGKAIGLTIGAYGFGAVLSAQIFDLVLRVYSLPALLLALGTVSMIISCVAGMLAGFGQSIEPQDRNNSSLPGIRARLGPLWICYCLAAFAGLMVLAHGPSIAALSGNTKPGVAAGLVSLGSIFGSYLGGACADRVSGRVSLSMPILLQFFAVGCLALAPNAPGAL